MKKHTLVVGATDNSARYAHKAATLLAAKGHPITLLGTKAGQVAGADIQQGHPALSDIDTVTLYVGPQNQPPLYDYLLGLRPRRVIFNPGTENPEFEHKLRQQGIETVQACTLVLLSIGDY